MDRYATDVDSRIGPVNSRCMRAGRYVAVGLSIVFVASVLGIGAPVPASAGCAGPTMAVGASVDDTGPSTGTGVVRRGESIVVSGLWFHSGCEDTVSTSVVGCSARTDPPLDPEAPLADVVLNLRQGSRSWRIDTGSAGDRAGRYAITWHGTVPADATPGGAVLQAGSATVPVTLR
jgi:hypothetical protein